jgi:hypothetical protein
MTAEKANEMNEERALENGDDSAFPNQDTRGFLHYGLTKREYIATQLMAAAMAGHCSPEEALNRAIKGVDLLLIELNKK